MRSGKTLSEIDAFWFPPIAVQCTGNGLDCKLWNSGGGVWAAGWRERCPEWGDGGARVLKKTGAVCTLRDVWPGERCRGRDWPLELWPLDLEIET